MAIRAVGEHREHVDPLKIFGDGLKIRHGGRVTRSCNCLIKAITYVILDQGAFGLQNGLLNSVELLSDIGAGSIAFDHCNDALKVTIGTFKPLYDIWMGCMGVVLCHKTAVTPLGGYDKWAETHRNGRNETARWTDI